MNPQKFNGALADIKSDKQAIIPIYDEYYPKIILHLRCRFGNLVCPEDIAQDVFAMLLNSDKLPYVQSPTKWLMTVADNRATDVLRSQHKEVPLLEELAPPVNCDYSCLSVDIQRAFQEIDPVSRQIIYLHFWEGYSHNEIAEILGITCGNVRIKAYRAYKTLKKWL